MKKLFVLIAIFLPLAFFSQEDVIQQQEIQENESEELGKQLEDALSDLFSSKAEMKEMYDFKGKVQVTTTGKSEEPLTLELWIDDQGNNFGMNGLPGSSEMENAFIIMAKGDNAMFMCLKEAGLKYAMSMGIPKDVVSSEAVEKIVLEKKKEKKKILGHKCRKYVLEREYKSYNYWITMNRSDELTSMSNALTQMEFFKNAASLRDYGIILAMEEVNEFTEISEYVEVAEIDMDATYSFDATQYEVMSMKELMEMQQSLEEVPKDE